MTHIRACALEVRTSTQACGKVSTPVRLIAGIQYTNRKLRVTSMKRRLNITRKNTKLLTVIVYSYTACALLFCELGGARYASYLLHRDRSDRSTATVSLPCSKSASLRVQTSVLPREWVEEGISIRQAKNLPTYLRRLKKSRCQTLLWSISVRRAISRKTWYLRESYQPTALQPRIEVWHRGATAPPHSKKCFLSASNRRESANGLRTGRAG